MSIEHIKAHLSKARICPRQNGKSDQYESLQLLSITVAAVERVQALHTPNQFGHCIHCSHLAQAHIDHPCDSIEALETP